MRPKTLGEVAFAVSGTVRGAAGSDLVVNSLVVDSRAASPGALFVALPGERADGHAFVHDALARGAAAALVRRGWEGPGSVVEVQDPARALIDLARNERGNLRATVVGITGSTGKTSTKDLTAAVLAERFVVAASPASFNNEVGLPLTILSATEETEALVCEMGSRGPGHIRLLCEVAGPHVGVVTNVGVAHMELFGSPEALRDAKAELPEALPPGGTAVLNADDAVARSFAKRTPAATVVLFGTGDDAQVRARGISVSRETGAADFELITPGGSARVRLSVPGEHMVANALAAAAVGWSLGMSADKAAPALEGASVSAGRMQVVRAGGIRVVDDSYNANPASMAAALKAARWMAGRSRCVAVLGHMAELGPISHEQHLRIGELVARLGIDRLVVVGPEASLIAVGAEREGVEPDHVDLCDDVSQAIDVLTGMVRPGDLVLVKASRVARLERVVEALRAVAAPPEGEGLSVGSPGGQTGSPEGGKA
jgi:UDP-N-acetylmuramoyl-tripeptide--D-alanyl-D-alanine ligase